MKANQSEKQIGRTTQENNQQTDCLITVEIGKCPYVQVPLGIIDDIQVQAKKSNHQQGRQRIGQYQEAPFLIVPFEPDKINQKPVSADGLENHGQNHHDADGI